MAMIEPMNWVFGDVIVCGTLILGSKLIAEVCLSCESRITAKSQESKEDQGTKKVAIVTEPMKGAAGEAGWREEIRFRKYFITDDYVVLQAGPFREAYEIMGSLEKLVKDRKAAQKVVNFEIMSDHVQDKMDDLCVQKGCAYMESMRFLMVALDEDKKLVMKLFGFRRNNPLSEKGDIAKCWADGSTDAGREVAREIVKKAYDPTKLPEDVFVAHHEAMETVAKQDQSVGGQHRMITVWEENGVLKTKRTCKIVAPGLYRVQRVTKKAEE